MASKTTYELQVKLGAKASPSWKTTLKNAQKDLESFESFNNKLATGIAAGAVAAGTAAAYAVNSATEVYKDFEQEMMTVKSISGANTTQFLEMKDAAMDAGRNTIFTATESASALEYMSLAGWDTQQSITGLTPILRLAAATQKELQTTSDLVTDSMNALGIGIDGLDTYLDKLVMGNNKANSTSEEFMQSLVKSGGAARVLGASLNDTITATGILADNGKKAEESGTALNAIFVRLAGNAEAIKELKNLKVSIWNDDGTYAGFENTLIRINDALSGLTDENKAAALKKIAGTHHYSDLAYLLESVKTDTATGISAWDNLEGYIENSSGALGRMYETSADTLKTAEKILNSATEDMQIRVTDVFSDDAKDFVLWIANEIPKATDAIVEFAEAHRGEFAEALETAGEAIETAWKYGETAGEWLLDNRKAVIGGLEGIAAGFVAVKAATTGMKIAQFFTNPLNTSLGAIELGVVALSALSGAAEDAQNKMIEADLADHFGSIALSAKELEQAAEHITGIDMMGGVLSSLEEYDKLDTFEENMNEALENIKKADWKVSIGMELTADEQNSYKTEIDNYVKNAQEYVQQTGYAVALTLGIDDENSDISAIESKVNAFYQNSYTEMEELGKELSKAVNDAFSDGVLDPEEIANISEIQQKMADLKAQLATGEFEAQLSLLGTKYGGELTPESMEALIGEINDQEDTARKAYEEQYVKKIGALETARTNGEITDNEYNQAAGNYKNEYMDNVNALETRSGEFVYNTIYEQYGGDLEGYGNKIAEEDSEKVKAYVNMTPEQLATYDYDPLNDYYFNTGQGLKDDEDFKTTMGAIKKMLDAAEPLFEKAKDAKSKTEAEGGEVSEDLENLVKQTTWLQNLANGDMDAIYGLIGAGEGRTSVYQSMKQAAASGRSIPTAALDAATEADTQHMRDIQDSISTETQALYDFSQNEIKAKFSKGFVIDADADITINPMINIEEKSKKKNKASYYLGDVYSNAEGGIYNTPILTTFAEKGAEAAIPLDGSQRAKSLWMQAGSILGTLPQGNRDGMLLEQTAGSRAQTGNMQITFSPTITIQGNATRDEVQQGLTIGMNDLKRMIKEISAEQARTTFLS